MTEPTRSMPDIAEQLMSEFEGVIPVSTVTEVVMRLSRDGSVPLAALHEIAREELRAVALPDGAAA